MEKEGTNSISHIRANDAQYMTHTDVMLVYYGVEMNVSMREQERKV